MTRLITAVSLLAAISAALDGRYARAGVLTLVAAGTAVAGHRQRREAS